jgi:hypothetical protein
MASRLNKQHTDIARLKIKTSQLINRLSDHALGKVDLSTTQVRSIEILLRKTVPDLSQVTGTFEHRHRVEEMSDADLTDIATTGRSGAIAPQSSAPEPDQLH